MQYFDVHDVWFWLKVATLCISGVATIFSIILAIKKRKIKFSELINNLISWIEEAETHTAWSGDEKMEFVLNRAFKYCVSAHIAYKEENVRDEAERLLAMSKSVNNKYHAPEEGTKTLNPAFTKTKREDSDNA